jgi:acetyltransferase-like isoleucine patch superfamily enzyme
MNKPGQFVKRTLLHIYWFYRNQKDDIDIQTQTLSPKVRLGKKTMIRRDNEVYNIELGDYSYISGPRSYIEDAQIGKYCSIARQVTIGVSDHNYNWVTTSPIITSKSYGFINDNVKEPQKLPPVIGNDVWVGMNVIIMRGVTIGDGAIIAAGSVVTRDIEPYSIVAGIPARHLRYRFSEVQIQELLKIQWWNWDEQKIRENAYLFYDIDKFIETHLNKVDVYAKNQQL